MHYLTITIILLTLFCLALPGSAEEARVARYRGDRAAAVSLTFDDGMRNQYELAVPLLNKYGFHGTFFIVAGPVAETDAEALARGAADYGSISWPQLKALAQQGHEIGNHSLTHANLIAQNDAGLEKEITQAYQRITEKVGVPPLTFCYPGNGYDARVRTAVQRRHLFGRETCYGYGGPAAQANAWVDEAIAHGGWIVAMIHGITEGYAHYATLADFADHLAYLKKHEDQVWVDTFANVGCYVMERDSAVLHVERQGSSAVVTLTCTRPVTPPVPLTVVLPAPGAATATAPVPLTVGKDCVLLEITPGAGAVKVTWETK